MSESDNNSNANTSTAATTVSEAGGIHTAVVHPLVLLSVVDHYSRVAKDTKKRVVGILLGEIYKGTVDISNSFAVPFEEDSKDPSVWFLDHNYHEQMHRMFKKVNARENVVGWYSTGPKVRSSDLEINELIRNYTPNPVLVIIDPTDTNVLGLPTKAYVSVEQVSETRDGTAKASKAFKHITSAMGALEAEEVGVEHLLRDIRRMTNATLAGSVESRGTALRSLEKRIGEIQEYVSDVRAGKLPLSQRVMTNLQDIFNLAPAVTRSPLAPAFASATNDMMLMIYIASMVRSVIALHNLLLNKRQLKEDEARDIAAEDAADAAKQAKKDQKDEADSDDKKKNEKK